MKTIYWAFKLSDSERAKLLKYFPPVHPHVYAEHSTIVFGPSKSMDLAMMNFLGLEIDLAVIGHRQDMNGQAVVVEIMGLTTTISGTPHITISCANGVRPVYSNDLLKKHWKSVSGPTLKGTVARFTSGGWDLGIS